MLGMLEEFLMILAYSRRVQATLIFGAISFIAISMWGIYLVDGIQFHGMLAPLTNPVREALLGSFEKAAWGALGASLMLAIRNYLKDRNRLLSL